MALFGRFTERAQRALQGAQHAAVAMKHHYVGTEHLLMGLMQVQDDKDREMLQGITAEQVQDEILRVVEMGDAPVTGALSLTPRTKKVLDGAMAESRALGQNYICLLYTSR